MLHNDVKDYFEEKVLEELKGNNVTTVQEERYFICSIDDINVFPGAKNFQIMKIYLYASILP